MTSDQFASPMADNSVKACISHQIDPHAINLYSWIGHQNFGDELSPYLIEKLTGTPPHLVSKHIGPKLVAIGSVITHALPYDSIFWGSGILNEVIAQYLIHVEPYKPHQDRFYALRGPLTASALALYGNYCLKMPKVFGDPAILLPYVYTAQPLQTHYKLGIILHHTQQTDTLEKIVAEKFQDQVKVISIYREGNDQLEACIDEICSCDKIASTSLHGIIVAQAYGIPAIFLQNLNEPVENHCKFKFNDYFLGTKQKTQVPIQFTDYNELIPQLLAVNFPEPPELKDCCERLLNVFPYPDKLVLRSLS